VLQLSVKQLLLSIVGSNPTNPTKNKLKMKFKIGDEVYKPKGYKFPGIVVSVFQTTSGETRIVAELKDNGMLHIFSESQLELVEKN
jgi:hypothetical protein